MLETQKTFSALCEEFVECYLRDHPVYATEVGIHDYDHVLPNDTPEGFQARAAWLRDLEQRLVASVPWTDLSVEQRIDWALLRSRIAGLRADLEEIRVPAHNPALYPETALKAVNFVMSRPFAPLDERKESILDRMMAVPDYLAAARANLETVPAPHAERAAELSGIGVTFMEEVTQQLIRSFPNEAERIEHAGSVARRGFAQFQDWVQRDLRSRIGGSYAIGERWLNYKLEREHLLSLDATALEAFGREQIERFRGLLEAEAKRLDPARTWRALIDEARRRHPNAAQLAEAYAGEMERARRFVEDRRLVPPVPATCRLELRDTPPFDRSLVRYAAYQAPAVFDADHVGWFCVTPADLSRPAAEQAQQLQAHNHAAITLICVHEAWPGRHLQASHALGAGSRLRRLIASPLFAEGWAVYCEELMWEQGFFQDPATRLHQLRNLLWRACRVVVDAALHSGRMTFEEAVALMEEEPMLEHAGALSEVRHCLAAPTRPMSYLVGMQSLLEVREEAGRALGSRFDLLGFHSALLAGGTLPFALVREEIWGRLGVTTPP